MWFISPWSPVSCFAVTVLFGFEKLYNSDQIAADERVVFFPTAASHLNATHWNIPIHGWIFEPEEESKKRKAFMKVLGKLVKADKISSASSDSAMIGQKPVLNRRMWPFVVDNQSMRRPIIELAGSRYRMPRSGKNGHFRTNLIISQEKIRQSKKGSDDGIISYQAVDKIHNRTFSGVVHLIPPNGISVISDIDDTIKITNYLDKKEFIKNTFLREFKAVPGMPELFQHWKSQHNICCFHYVSASPYQLYEELNNFVHRAGFPPATFHLKTVRPKDKTILQLFADPLDYKRKQIEKLLQQFPNRTFFLVGDSGEKDPEVYAGVINDYPSQVAGMWIRNVNNVNPAQRMEGLEVPSEKWQFFTNGSDLLLDK